MQQTFRELELIKQEMTTSVLTSSSTSSGPVTAGSVACSSNGIGISEGPALADAIAPAKVCSDRDENHVPLTPSSCGSLDYEPSPITPTRWESGEARKVMIKESAIDGEVEEVPAPPVATWPRPRPRKRKQGRSCGCTREHEEDTEISLMAMEPDADPPAAPQPGPRPGVNAADVMANLRRLGRPAVDDDRARQDAMTATQHAAQTAVNHLPIYVDDRTGWRPPYAWDPTHNNDVPAISPIQHLPTTFHTHRNQWTRHWCENGCQVQHRRHCTPPRQSSRMCRG